MCIALTPKFAARTRRPTGPPVQPRRVTNEWLDGVTFRAASFLDDYLFRPATLEEISLYELIATHFCRKRTLTAPITALFMSEHPLFNSHCIGVHENEVVPVVMGMRMSFINADSQPELVVQRSQCALVLFKPFRVVTDLVANPISWTAWNEAYSQW